MCHHVPLIRYHLMAGVAYIDALIPQRRKSRESGKGTQSRLESQPQLPASGPPPCSHAALLSKLLLKDPSGELGDPPAGAGIPSLFVLLEKPGLLASEKMLEKFCLSDC